MFLPDNAQEPKAKKNYTMPLEEGSQKLRVLSSAIIGYEGWKKEGDKNTPVRYKVGEQPEFGPDGKEPKYFWAFTVWNYEQERVQIMFITQKTIRTAFEAYVNNEAWGDPQKYDLVITRRGMKLDDTEYSLIANPKTELAEEIKTAYRKAEINLNALWTNDDPFEANTQSEPQNVSEGQIKPNSPAESMRAGMSAEQIAHDTGGAIVDEEVPNL